MWDWILARGIPKKRTAPVVEPVIEFKKFSESVGNGFVDDLGVWHVTRHAAEYATAKRYIKEFVNACHRTLPMSQVTLFSEVVFAERISQHDTIRAMDILSSGNNLNYDPIRAQFESECG